MGILTKLFSSSPVKHRMTKQQPDGGTYELYTGPTRKDARDFLHDFEVKQDDLTVVVETPEGNIAKDYIRIYEEFSKKTLELNKRKQRSKPKPSLKACCSCEYPVAPFAHKADEKIEDLSPHELANRLKRVGAGYVCRNCRTLICAVCAYPEERPLCPICMQKPALYKVKL